MSTSVDPNQFKKRVSAVKLIKPFLGDYVLSIIDRRLYLFSSDRRHSIMAFVADNVDEPDCEYFVPSDRVALIDSSNDSVSIAFNAKQAAFKFKSSSANKSATFKSRSDISKKRLANVLALAFDTWKIDKKELEFILKSLSASALVRNTKTEEDMRINQVHFYKDHAAAVSNARFYASSVTSPSICFDCSIVSSDIPIIRNFISQCDGFVQISVSPTHVFVANDDASLVLSCSKVITERPKYVVPVLDNPANTFSISTNDFKELVRWTSLALEGTSRATFCVDNGRLSAHNGASQLYEVDLPESVGAFRSDFPMAVVSAISEYIDDGLVSAAYNYPDNPDIFTLSQSMNGTRSAHYIRAMRSK